MTTPPDDTELGERATSRRAAPADLLALAREKWLADEPLVLGKLAEELGVGRATVFRWAGSREALYGEVVWQEIASAYASAREHAGELTGAARVGSAARTLMTVLLSSKPMKAFIARDATFAMRVLVSAESPVERRLVGALEQTLTAQRDAGHIDPAMELKDLAFVLVRIAESFMYRDVLGGRGARPDVEAAVHAIEILVDSRAPEH
ncbi:MAG: hypothetical protein EP330_04910 [Deltaproteobacteria bacterium]|nr:MAG: hypothetical protein EP330_04910 [Deltaproteobacteria bacterium]